MTRHHPLGEDLAVLRCPRCRAVFGAVADAQQVHHVRCTRCAASAATHKGFLHFTDPAELKGVEAVSRRAYDSFAWLHDISLKLWLPLSQDGVTAHRMREQYLDQLRPSTLGPEARVLDVGTGSGGNLWQLWPTLKPSQELWALDVSVGMLRRLVAGLERRGGGPKTRVIVADAHDLPFADASFDAVLQVGAINLFRKPGRALREMVRVAKEGARIVIVDEALDGSRPHGLWARSFFHNLTMLDPDPHVPLELLPPEATDVSVRAVSRFYYCLAFTRGPSPQFAHSETVEERWTAPVDRVLGAAPEGEGYAASLKGTTIQGIGYTSAARRAGIVPPSTRPRRGARTAVAGG